MIVHLCSPVGDIEFRAHLPYNVTLAFSTLSQVRLGTDDVIRLTITIIIIRNAG